MDVRPTCSDCRHWHRLPADPNNLGQVRGECRERLHSAQIPQQAPNGVIQMAQIVYYPPVPPKFIACGQFAARIDVATFEGKQRAPVTA